MPRSFRTAILPSAPNTASRSTGPGSIVPHGLQVQARETAGSTTGGPSGPPIPASVSSRASGPPVSPAWFEPFEECPPQPEARKPVAATMRTTAWANVHSRDLVMGSLFRRGVLPAKDPSPQDGFVIGRLNLSFRERRGERRPGRQNRPDLTIGGRRAIRKPACA